MTGDRRDESVSFSLKELMKLEDERIDGEKRARDAEAAATQRARDEEAKKKRDEEARVAKERDEAAERERRRAADEEARREATARAAMEEARLAVEARARAEEADRERQHELALARLKSEGTQKGGAGVVIGSGLVGLALALAASVVLHFAVVKPKHDASITALEGRVAAAEKRANDVAFDGERDRARALKAEGELGAAQRTIEELKSAPKVPTKTGPTTNVRGPTGAPPPSTTKAPLSEPCASGDDHDPLCGRILRK